MAGLKILGGTARGRRLQGESVAGVRPTSARVREAIFDILGARVGHSVVLDLYAGTGAVGLEALSRGASRAVFVERNPRAVRAIAANLAALGGLGEAEILRVEAGEALARLAQRGERFDIVFLDPPWDEAPDADRMGLAARLVRPSGVLLAEHRAGHPPPLPSHSGMTPGRVYRYGDAALSLFRAPAATG